MARPRCPLAFSTQPPPTAAAKQAEPQAHIERRNRSIGEAYDEEIDNDNRDQQADAEQRADKGHAIYPGITP